MNTHDNELDFLALQYIGDELSDDARAAFEARLLDDQAAREAVAGAVEVSLAAREAFADDAILVAAKRDLEQPSSSRAWWNVALACGILAALVTATKLMQRDAPPVAADPSLAIAWSEARAEWPTSALSADEIEETELLALNDEVSLPTWMIAAVSADVSMPEMTEGDEIPE